MSIYKKIFVDSAKMSWFNPKYWLFGVFAIFFGGSVELELFDNFFSQSKNIYYDMSNVAVGSLFSPSFWNNLPAAATSDFPAFAKIVFIFLSFVTILAVVIILSVLAQLVIMGKVYRLRSAGQIKDSQTEGIKALFRENSDKIWPVAGLNIIYKVLILLIFLLIGLPIMITANNPTFMSDVSYMLLFIMLLPAAIVAAMIMRYATIYIKIKGLDFKEAVAKGWTLFRNNWLLTTEVSLLLFLVTVTAGLLVVILTYSLAIPFWFAGLAISFLPKQLFVILIGLYILSAFTLFVAGGSLVTTFNVAVWTNLFAEIDNKRVGGKISQILNKIGKK